MMAVQIVAWAATLRTVYLTNPSLLGERAAATRHANTQAFDRVLFPAFILTTLGCAFSAAAQHRLRPAAPHLPLAWQAAALPAFAAAVALECAALVTNRWFSSVVRLQPDRGQRVCSAGVYAAVRHPAYAGVLLQAAAEAVLLQSSWAAAWCGARAAVIVVRAALEDGLLRRELPGYAEYAAHVRWRLVPGVW